MQKQRKIDSDECSKYVFAPTGDKKTSSDSPLSISVREDNREALRERRTVENARRAQRVAQLEQKRRELVEERRAILIEDKRLSLAVAASKLSSDDDSSESYRSFLDNDSISTLSLKSEKRLSSDRIRKAHIIGLPSLMIVTLQYLKCTHSLAAFYSKLTKFV